MGAKQTLTLLFVITVAVASVPVATLGQPTASAQPSPAVQDTANATDAGTGQVQQPDDGTCNYVQLYNQTIDSIVQIQTASGLGSGFVFDLNEENGTGYVVTNEHVVNESGIVGVRFSQGNLSTGQVVGATAYADLAVVRVNETPEYVDALSVTNDTPQPGEKVAALGSPFGLESTITSGIISGVNRTMPTRAGVLPNAIQTDAPINPGNSGGPLVLCGNGTVAGVNQAGGAENIGFAISASLVNQIAPVLIQNGTYEFPYLGIRPAPLTQPIIEANDLNVTSGVYVAGMMRGSPASEELQEPTGFEIVNRQRVPVGGDVIVGIDGQRVETREELLGYVLTETRPGDTVDMTVIRDGERQNVSVTMGERPEPRTTA
ncbi:trypsin-like peptidase domain-containing protein [Natrinema sp. 1APR25-10V2]|uniref:S1C family serine protease n=1 Tax=Natrinema sp. 1APR25-10V2 TaxID=2951081 RepID=UPI002875B88F|nr:trypsin-like peptidase domain-containing protein [Natrinema sp. 1APR25-10V2]MDS0473946.1 trypsin-like peptidase domain-containing protein [Natrinema sp. 1APR25-10V2]